MITGLVNQSPRYGTVSKRGCTNTQEVHYLLEELGGGAVISMPFCGNEDLSGKRSVKK